MVTVVIFIFPILYVKITSLVLMVVLLIGIKAPMIVFWKMQHLKTTQQTDPVVLYSGLVRMVLCATLLLLIIRR